MMNHLIHWTLYFHYNMPSNDKETIENLEKLEGMGAISLETIPSQESLCE